MTEVQVISNYTPSVPLLLNYSEKKPSTPNHLLMLRDNPNLLPSIFETNNCYMHKH